MKTKYDVIREVIAQKVAEGIERDIREQLGYGDRIKKAGMLVLADGVKHTGQNNFQVASGSDSTKTYAVNGTCTCQDAQNWSKHEHGEKVATYAPRGLCKHKMAVELWKHAHIHLKESKERFGLPHFDHRWTCEEHRTLAIECWHRICPDPIQVECPTCAAARLSDTQGEPLEENPNVPAYLEEVIKEEDVEMQEFTIDRQAESDPSPCPHVTKAADFEAQEAALDTPLVYVAEQYEPAPLVVPTVPPLPEAPVSMYIKFKVENFELSYTMRAHTDREVIERLPGVLAGLEDILKIEVDHDEPFLKRLLHAFFPKPSRYTGK